MTMNNSQHAVSYGTVGIQFVLDVAPHLRQQSVTVQFAEYSGSYVAQHPAMFPYGDCCIITAGGRDLTGNARKAVLRKIALVGGDSQ